MRSKKPSDPGSPGRPRRGAAGRAKKPSAKPRPVAKGADGAPDSRRPRAAATRATSARVWTGANRILAALPPKEMVIVQRKLSPIVLESGEVLYAQQSHIDKVYFPETAVVSLLSRMANDAVVEVGTIGNEGMVGLNLFLGADVSLPETLAQVPGTAQYMTADAFRATLTQLPTLRSILAKCVHAFVTQVSQTAACNRLHGIEQRCARWLLLTHDRVGGTDTFSLTHQFLSFMLGVRRAGVTEALGALTLAGLIKSVNGSVTILDRAGLEAACCECYAIVRLHAGAPFAPSLASRRDA